MSYVKLVDGVELPMTADEIAERQAEEAEWSSDAPRREARENLRVARLQAVDALPHIVAALLASGALKAEDVPASVAAIPEAVAAALALEG